MKVKKVEVVLKMPVLPSKPGTRQGKTTVSKALTKKYPK